MQLTEFAKHQINARLTALMKACDVIDAAVVSTIDGNLFAMQQTGKFPLDRLATMGSSLMALGDTITAELSLGHCDKIISENQDGLVAFMHVNSELVLITVTKHKTGLGLLLSHSRNCAHDIAKMV